MSQYYAGRNRLSESPVTMRFCLPPFSLNGLGNHAFCWAKAFIASEVLSAHLLHPAWSRNPRGYRDLFGTSSYDWEIYRALTKVLPVFEFSEDDYRQVGGGDYSDAILAYADQAKLWDRRRFVLFTPGMWGGYAAIRGARHFLLEQLFRARTSRRCLYWVARNCTPGRLTVAVHIRRGDFSAAEEPLHWRGVLNACLPIDWYINICKQLESHFKEWIQFILYSDGTEMELATFCQNVKAVQIPKHVRSETGELISMGSADLLLCSSSTFSLLAAFLSDSPYIWFEPQLDHDGSHYTLASEGLSRKDGQVFGLAGDVAYGTAFDEECALPRGIPMKPGEVLAEPLLNWLKVRLALKRPERDLLYYGKVHSR